MTDEATQSSMLDDFVARLDGVENRLAAHVAAAAPTGLTEPDPDGTERWEAGQVWSHMAEFVPYWKGQVASIVAAYDGDPVPFGRLKDDPGRLSGIEKGQHEAVRQMGAEVHDSIENLKGYLAGLASAEWSAVGLHPVRGELDVESIVGRFVVSHLEEHADQLDLLAGN